MMYMSDSDPSGQIEKDTRKSRKTSILILLILVGTGLIMAVGYTTGWSIKADTAPVEVGIIEENINNLPVDFPADIPVYPNMTSVKVNQNSDGMIIGYNANITDQTSVILGWYKTEFKKLEWTVIKSDGYSITAKKREEIIHVLVLTTTNGPRLLTVYKD